MHKKNYLAIHDQVSTYSWMCPLQGTDTSHILKELKILQFELYCKEKHIAHQTSSPYYPTYNSYSEMVVRRCKFALMCTELTKQCPQQLLRQSQTLHLSDCQASPQEMFLKYHITPSQLSTTFKVVPQDWGKKIKTREEFQMERINKAQNIQNVQGYHKGAK